MSAKEEENMNILEMSYQSNLYIICITTNPKCPLKKRHPFITAPLNRVFILKVYPPDLHVSLGLWSKFFSLLETDLQKLGADHWR